SVPCKALIGPWGHTYPYFAEPVALDWKVEEVRWWHHWLNDIDTGIMDEPRVRMFMPYATAEESLPEPIPGRWIEEANWPPPAKTLTIGLGQGSLHERTIVGLRKPEWLNRLPQEQSSDDDTSLVFDTLPLTEDIEMLGCPVLRARVASDAAA